ncbi:MAG: hypothetical protein HY842_06140 [Bacteroidetes bacterium]|nr:hypothetical protein [Bacteroidota bacterium]
MKITFATIILGLLSQVCTAQKIYNTDRIAFKITPTSLFNPHVACILPGLEVKINQNISVEFEYGIQYEKLGLAEWNWYKKDWNYHKIKGGVRYNVPLGETASYYFEAEVFTVDQQYYKTDGYVRLANRQAYRFEKSDIERDTRGFCFNYGVTGWFARHFFVEFYCGVGLKWVSIDHELFNESAVDNIPEHEWIIFPPRDQSEGEWSLLHADAGIKVGVSLFKMKAEKGLKL